SGVARAVRRPCCAVRAGDSGRRIGDGSGRLHRMPLHPSPREDRPMRANPVKRALKAGEASVGTWLSLGSVTAARFLARAGFAWLTVDTEHTATGVESAANMFAAIADAGCVALARVLSNRHDHIKRALDTGAMGVVVPMVNTRAEA